MKIELYEVTGEELARAEEQWAYSSMVEKCRLWAVDMCRRVRGHDWYLEIDPYEGISLYCRKCPADVNDVCPDGHELMTGEFEVCPGYVLSLYFGSVHVNGTDYDGFTYGWRGPVAVVVDVTRYPAGPWGGEEYDVWVEVEARHDS